MYRVHKPVISSLTAEEATEKKEGDQEKGAARVKQPTYDSLYQNLAKTVIGGPDKAQLFTDDIKNIHRKVVAKMTLGTPGFNITKRHMRNLGDKDQP